MIRVLIVDDSALMRELLTAILSSDPGIEVVGTANDPYQARTLIKELNPDVLTLDVEMPKMDGISFLEKIMRLRPMPVVMVSTLTQKHAEITVRALEMGAVDVVGKPTIDMKQGMEERREELIAKVHAAARARVSARQPAASSAPREHRPAGSFAAKAGPGFRTTDTVVAIGSSTGGVEALREVIGGLPPDSPAVVVTQHMPGGFTRSFADRLNALAAVAVAEASDGARILPGHVYIAPGDHHLEVVRSGGTYVCRLHDGPAVSGHRPSVDVLFHSVAAAAGANGVGVILTGMGKDGAIGLKAMRDAGARTIGQDEDTSLVYGMPKAAFNLGGVERQLPLDRIADAIVETCRTLA
ncbi:protein-glutamate methylesterase/protein-glutamine glutaminase [Novispirillum sp. DQ9]|uniref:protein-glutamate methylesterase/protein-glutamine glutaminase n=1 Tax=Novispirillum sp. DQ9 TaxID=3398612 RepID=UPI003C7A0AAF